MRILELFSGTGSVGKVAQQLGWDVVAVDISDELGHVDILVDIMKWDYKTYPPKHFDIIWGSPPCATFSILQYCTVGRNGRTKEGIVQKMHSVGVPVLMKLLEIIMYFQPSFWFIENPKTGRMKEFLSLPYYDVDYCRYGYNYKKPTRIWTNVIGFENKQCMGAGKCHAMVGNKHVGKVAGTADSKAVPLNERYSIPQPLLEDLLVLCM